MRPFIGLAFLGAVGLTACKGGPSPATPPTAPASGAAASGAASASPAPAAGPTGPTDRTDPGPSLKRESGEVAPKVLPPVTVQAEAVKVEGGALYLEVAMPADLSGLPAGVLVRGRVLVQGDRHGLAVPAGEGRVGDRPLAYVRLVGTAKAPAELTLSWLQPSTGHDPGARVQITVKTGTATERGELAQRFFEAAGRWFKARSVVGQQRQDLFSAYASARLDRLANLALPEARRRAQRASRSDLSETMALYSGLTSIEEALQADRGLALAPDNYTGPAQPLAEVKPVDLPGHPWGEMMAALGGQPAVEPLARYAPGDHLYLHFHDLRTLVRLAEDADGLLRPVAHILEERAGDRRLATRYERQLGVERMGLSKTLGHVAAKGVALIASDPFLRDGTDVSILFHLRNGALIEQALASYEARTRARRPDVKVSDLTIGGKAVRRLWTADGEVNQYRVALDAEVLALSNSEAGVTSLLAVQADPTTALAASGEYRYFRMLYRYDPEQEDGFIFLSDSFVLNAVSPRTKILQGRRLAGWSELMAVNQAALLYGWLQGERPKRAADLVALGVLDASQLTHAGGGAIDFDPATGASSKTWGRPDRLRPLAEIEATTATRREVAAYERFRETYRNYWRGFIDPIGVRVMRGADGKQLRLDARMLPLIQGSDYNRIARDVGKMRVQPGDAPDGLRVVLAVGQDAQLRRTLGELGRTASGSRDIGIDWLGDWVMIGTADRSGLWDAALSLGEVPGMHRPGAFGDIKTRKEVIDRLPLYLGAHVGQPLALAAGLAALKGLAMTAAPGMLDWGPSGAYRDVEVVTVREKIDGDGVSVHYAVAKQVLLLAFNRATLEAQIDAALDGKLPIPAAKDAPEADAPQSFIDARPAGPDGWLNRTLLGLMEWGGLRAHRSGLLAWEDLVVGLPGLAAEAEARDATALQWLGYIPGSPHGGAFTVAPGGEITHAIYGSEVAPKWPPLPVEGSPVTAFLRDLAGLHLSLSFEGEDRTRSLRTKLRWERR